MPQTKKNQLRIIGGHLRGRKVSFIENSNIRPTPDRIRETLFNWLQNKIVGSECLDLFCGSGILGLEALSRGAKHVTSIDKDKSVTTHLNKIINELKVDNLTILTKAFPFQPDLADKKFDLIFLDPPFRKNLAEPCLNWIVENNLLKDAGLVYLETEKDLQLDLPEAWQEIKNKVAGQVCYRLLYSLSG